MRKHWPPRASTCLVLNARNAQQLEQLASEISPAHKVRVKPVAGDIASVAGRETVLAACPSPDILVNNAGGPPPGKLKTRTAVDWSRALEGNLRAPAAMLAAVLDGMAARGFGRVVNITSSVVRHPIDVQGLSAAARAGLHGLVSTLVREHVGRNDTINNILPGPFATDRLISNFTFRAKQEGIRPEQAPSGTARQTLWQSAGGRPALRLSLQRACRLYLRTKHSGRRRCASANPLITFGVARPFETLLRMG